MTRLVSLQAQLRRLRDSRWKRTACPECEGRGEVGCGEAEDGWTAACAYCGGSGRVAGYEDKADERRDAALCLLIADASRYDPVAPCPHGCGDTNDHRATKAQVTKERCVGDTLCPRVQRTHRKGEASAGQDPRATYFRPPTSEEIARWNTKNEGEQRAETKRRIRESQEEIVGAAK